MRVSVFGLGYVGSVTGACLADMGHEVVGVDVSERKLATLGAGRAPVVEPGLDELVERVVGSGALRVTADAAEAVSSSDVSVLCVGTPSRSNGSLDLDALEHVCAQIGAALATKQRFHVIVIRSTVLPGTVRQVLAPIVEDASQLAAGIDFGMVMNPEFLRETSAVSDFRQPSLTLIGRLDERSGKLARELYRDVDAPVIEVPLETAEMIKYANNAFHATKVAFANEIGAVSKANGIDGREVMEILCLDDRLNISPAYLKPGFAYGGSCLPKDLRALVHRGREQDLDIPLLDSVGMSNEMHLRRGIAMVERSGRKKVGILGLSFKAGTDDVRESPAVPLIETLVGRGHDVRVYDETVRVGRLEGSNKSYIDREVPHIAALLSDDLDEVLSHAEVVVVCNGTPTFRTVPSRLRDDQLLVDLIGLSRDTSDEGGAYEGICW